MSLPSKVNDQPAYCLHRINYGDNSYILDCLTRDFGRVSIMVKGGKKRKNQADFQIFQLLSINFTGKSDLKTLTGLECRPYTLTPKANLAGMYANELLLKLITKHEVCEELFFAYQQLILKLSDEDLEEPLRMFEWQLLSFLGVLAEFTTDCRSYDAIQEELVYQYHPEQGFFLVQGKKGHLGGHILAIEQNNYDKLVLTTAKTIMRQTINWQLNGKELKTRALFKQLFSH